MMWSQANFDSGCCSQIGLWSQRFYDDNGPLLSLLPAPHPSSTAAPPGCHPAPLPTDSARTRPHPDAGGYPSSNARPIARMPGRTPFRSRACPLATASQTHRHGLLRPWEHALKQRRHIGEQDHVGDAVGEKRFEYGACLIVIPTIDFAADDHVARLTGLERAPADHRHRVAKSRRLPRPVS